MDRKPFLRQFRFILPFGLAILLISSPTGAQSPYSVDLVAPDYIEANTVLSLKGDDAYKEVALPFPFTFFGRTYDRVYVSSNGYLSFIKGYYTLKITSIPQPTNPNGAIYAFWDDLYVDSAASVRTQELGSAPNRRFVIEWRNVTFSCYGCFKMRVNFEVVLHENGVILLQYRNSADQYRNSVDEARQKGKYATVGVEDETGSSAVVVFENQETKIGAGETAVRFAHLARSVPVDVRPGGCPNPLNVDSNGVLPVAILGTPNLDVKTIDPNTVTLGGGLTLSSLEDPLKSQKKVKIVVRKLTPLRWSFEDVGTPYEPLTGKVDPNQCNNLGPDGQPDIVFKFDTQSIAASVGEVADKEAVTLQLRGQLFDGTQITGEDIVIIRKGKDK